jgi:hypothetical protein
MTSMVLGDSTLESLTPSVNAPLACQEKAQVMSMYMVYYMSMTECNSFTLLCIV